MTGPVSLSADEVLATVQELYPRELRIAMLTVANRRLTEQVADLEDALKAQLPDPDPVPDNT